MLLMLDVEVIADPTAAAVALEPVRSRLLAELTEPASAATLAGRLGIARQKINTTSVRWKSIVWWRWQKSGNGAA